MTDTRICEQCGTVFTPLREHARFCSGRCRVAWNREKVGDPAVKVRALQWSISAMSDTTERLARVEGWDQTRAFVLIGEAVWWVTIVDAELAALADDLQERGVALRILNLGVDTGTPAGKVVYAIIAAVAEMERALLVERTMSGLAAARARGRNGGRKPKLDAKKLRTAQALRDQGSLSMAEIAEQVGVSRSALYRNLAHAG